jgi:Cu(I)/Ag(I) efflux system membrane fusion protein
MNTRLRFIVALVVIVAVAAGVWWWSQRASGLPPVNASATAGNVLYWYDPMRPEVHFEKPGQSPFMDMELVPKFRESAEEGSVSISSRISQNLGVRTALATEGTVAPQTTVTGTVAVDERRLAVVATRAAGWIETLDVRATGDPVQKGQRLAGLYSPDIMAAQEEYLLAMRSDDTALIPVARRRLELLGVTTVQLDRIARRRAAERQVDIVAPMNGVITDLLVREGTAVASGITIVKLADLSEVWVIAEVPESQGSWLKTGQIAEVVLTGAGGEPIKGRFDYLYPEIAATTRTVRLRVVAPNEDKSLRPGASARVTLKGKPRRALIVPTEALIRSGERTAVILAEGEGLFRPVNVSAGLEQGDQTEIRTGLQAGDRIVVSGQFLIDSEANLRGALERLQPGESQ